MQSSLLEFIVLLSVLLLLFHLLQSCSSNSKHPTCATHLPLCEDSLPFDSGSDDLSDGTLLPPILSLIHDYLYPHNPRSCYCYIAIHCQCQLVVHEFKMLIGGSLYIYSVYYIVRKTVKLLRTSDI